MLVSPEGMKYYTALIFSFSCTNNTTEYESLAHGLEWVWQKKVKCLQIFGDSKLVVNQVRNIHVTKNDVFKMYKHRIWDLIESFDAFNLLSIPRSQNKETNRLVAFDAQFDIPKELQNVKR